MRTILNSLIFVLVTALAAWVFFMRSGMSVADIDSVEPQSLEIEDIVVLPEIKSKKTVDVFPEKTVEKISQEAEKTTTVTEVEKASSAEAVPEKKSQEVVVEKVETAITDKKSLAVNDAAAESIKIPSGTEKEKISPVVSIERTEKDAPVKKAEKIEKAAPRYICGWKENFEPDGHANGEKFADNWRREGGVLFTPKTKFLLRDDDSATDGKILVIQSKKSSAVFACDLSGKVDLNKTPILRWRWRVKKLPPFGDGRHRHKDDQAVGVYVGAGNAFNQKAIAYRWETETPLGHWGKTDYSKMMRVWFRCMRNQDSGLNVWFEETRNVKEDFIARYGFVPKKIALVICGNSQNSKSEALAEIDFIGFCKEVKK